MSETIKFAIAGEGDEAAQGIGRDIFNLLEKGYTKITLTHTGYETWTHTYPTTGKEVEYEGRSFELTGVE